jgi:hypothetical protein
MKIQIVVTFDVDPDTWDKEYHCGTDRDALRADVVQYVNTAVQSMVGSDGIVGFQSVSVRSNGKESR